LNGLETKKLEVVEACSGIRSLLTLVTLAVVFSYFSYPRIPSEPGSTNEERKMPRPLSLRSWGLWRSVLIVLSAVPIAILTNAFRVSGTGVLAHYYGTKVADGFFHSFSGWLIYISASLLLFLFAWVPDHGVALFSVETAAKRSAKTGAELLKSAGATVPPIVQTEGTE